MSCISLTCLKSHCSTTTTTMSFQSFYTTWLEQFQQLVMELRHALTSPITTEKELQLRQLVEKAISHHVQYYSSKSSVAKQDVLAFFSATWTTALERSLHWIGGWRPTTAFHLIYTESSILFESHMVDILRGFHTGDLGDLTPVQFRRVSELQIETVEEENDITDCLCDWQDEASDVVGMKYSDVDVKMDSLVGILERADQLRLKTIENLVELLTPQQAAEFLVAAAELHSGIHGWGVEQDLRRQQE